MYIYKHHVQLSLTTTDKEHANSRALSGRASSRGNPRVVESAPSLGYSAEKGCSGRGVQWMGIVLYSKTAYNRM